MKKILTLLSLAFVLPLTVTAVTVVATTTSTIPNKVVAPSAPIATTGTTILNVPFYAQEYTNSCEAAALRMALAYYKIMQRDMDIIRMFGYKPHLKDVAANVWDDPQQQFVGYVNATGRGQGYGVYGLPVVNAILEYGRRADYYTGTSSITAPIMAEAIRSGYPVIVWGYSSLTEKAYTWKSPEGKDITAFRGEHARLVVGVQGPTSAPTGFYVHDSLSKQKAQFWKTADLLKNIRAVPGVTDQMIVVR